MSPRRQETHAAHTSESQATLVSRVVRILLVEDSPNDALLVRAEVEETFGDAILERFETPLRVRRGNRNVRRRRASPRRERGAGVIGPFVRRAALAVACLAAVTSCRGGAKAEPAEPLVIASAQLPHAALMHVAVAGGHLAARGLDATVQRHAFGRPALEAVLDGKADVATVAETPVVLAALRGEEVAVIATISSAATNTVLLARKDAGIAAGTDLAGKRIGVPRGTSGEFFLDTMLVRHRVERAAVHDIDLKPEEMLEALERRQVDAVAVWYPVASTIQQRLGESVLTFDAGDLYAETFAIVARPQLVQDRPVALQRLLRALVDAEALFRSHPEEARRLVATELPGGDASSLRRFELRVRLDQSLLVLMEEEARWAIRAGLVPKQAAPNFAAALAPEPLLAVRPDAVRLIR
jgi:NitT/TauT family transport system substrate-binding protein